MLLPRDSPSAFASTLTTTIIVISSFGSRTMAQQMASSDPPPARTPQGKAPSPTPDQTTPAPTPTSEDATTTTTTTTPSSTPDATSDSGLTANPTITRGPQATAGGELSGLPTLTRNIIPTYPPPAVPPTRDAPFMRHSTLPEGTVFIAVGAFLGLLGLAILVYRAIVSLLLHRSVKRAAMAQHMSNSKAGFPAPPAPFYKYTDQESTMSLSAAGRGARRAARGPVSSANPSHSNLFFSPTAVNANAGSRASSLLPSGFYGAGTAPGSSAAIHANSISLHNLRPDSRGHYTNGSRHTLTGTPPDSPQYHPRRDAAAAASASSLHINPGSSSARRAPSAYLEDLLADDAVSLPPPPPPMQPSELPGSSVYGERTDGGHSRI